MTTTTASSGWTCHSCGTWTPSGQTHYCPSGYPIQGYSVNIVIPPEVTNLLEEIRDLLKRF